MSRSFRDSLRMVMEGAKEKTSDGMTPDAKKFRTDLHKIQDTGVKHMVQKDSETKDYERMFSGGVEKAPTRLADMEPTQDLDKYVEYNEETEIEEAKKCIKGCTCDKCEHKEEEKDEVDEQYFAATGGVPSAASQAAQYAQTKKAPAPNPRAAGAATTSYAQQYAQRARQATATTGASPTFAPTAAGSGGQTPAGAANPAATRSPMAGQGTANPANVSRKPMGAAMGSFGSKSGSATPKRSDFQQTGNAPKSQGTNKPGDFQSGPSRSMGTSAQAAKPQVKPAAKPIQQGPVKKNFTASATPGGGKEHGSLHNGFEIEINGTSYLVSEAHASAIAAFVEKYGEVNEKLTKKMSAGDVISDFVHSKSKQLAGRSKKDRIRAALAAHYDKKREK